MYFDIHTHKTSSKNSLYCHSDLTTPLPPNFNGTFTAGLHPWFLPTDIKEGLLLLKDWLDNKNCISLGECGLDRLRGPDIQYQEGALVSQINLAKERQLPFVVIHCVRAYDLLLKIFKETDYRGVFLLHDYLGGASITEELLKNDQVLFSLGSGLFRSSNKFHESLKIIPIEKLFFETDDSNHLIEAVYYQYASLTSNPIDKITEQIYRNIHNHLPKVLNL